MPDDKPEPPKNLNPRLEWASTGLASVLFFALCFFMTKWTMDMEPFRYTDNAERAVRLIASGICAVIAAFSFIGMFVVWFTEIERVGRAREYHRTLEKARIGPWSRKDRH